MSFFDRIKKAFAPTSSDRNYWIHVRCSRCGEVITARVDLMNDLSLDYSTGRYWTRKVLIGQGEARCFQPIEVTLTFDKNKQLIERTISGGEFLEPDQVDAARAAYQEALARAKAEAEARRRAREAALAAESSEETPNTDSTQTS
jgi:hypothetical protein